MRAVCLSVQALRSILAADSFPDDVEEGPIRDICVELSHHGARADVIGCLFGRIVERPQLGLTPKECVEKLELLTQQYWIDLEGGSQSFIDLMMQTVSDRSVDLEERLIQIDERRLEYYD